MSQAYSNYANLPDCVVKAILKANDAYDSGDSDFTPTSLAEPVYMSALKRKYSKQIVVEVISLLDAAVGTAFHELMEGGVKDDKEYLTEVRLYHKVGRWIIGAQLDNFHIPTGKLIDFKTCSAYAATRGKIEWTRQMAVQKLLLEKNGYKVNSMEIVAYVKDFNQNKKGAPGYPSHKLVVLPQEMWSNDYIEQGVLYRAQLHEDAKSMEPDDIEVCTDDEAWARGNKWAVCRRGVKRALKLFEFESDAVEHVHVLRQKEAGQKNPKGGLYHEFRPARPVRCIDWCTVSRWCRRHQAWLAEHNKKHEEAG